VVPWKRVGPALLGNEAKANLRVVRLQQDSDVIQGEIDGVCRPIVTELGLKHRGTAHFMLPGWLVLLFSLGGRQLRIFSRLSLGDLGRRVKAHPSRLRMCLAKRSSSQSDAARTCKIASAPSGSFQNISVPLTR
jgi:hypothetical protein